MPFLLTNPWLLAALAGLGIPVVLHLLMKRRQVRMRFSTVRFFVQQEPKARARRKLRNLFLLFLRLAVLALIVFAFARPFLPLGAGSGRRNPRQVVLVLDRSLSMQATDAGKSRWDAARDLVRKKLGSLTSADRVALVATGARTETLTPFSPPSVVAARLDELAPGASTAQLADGLREAVRLLAKAERGPDASILIVSDLQRDGVAGIESAPVPPGIGLEVLGVGDVLAPNLAIAVIQVDAGETNRPHLTLASHGDEDSARVPVELHIDGKPAWTRSVSLKAGGTTNLPLDLPALAHGWHHAEVRLGSRDALEADNRRSAVFYVPPPIRVLLVEGRRGVRSFEEQTFFISTALDPNLGVTNAGPGRFKLDRIDPAQLASRIALLPSSPGASTNIRSRLPFDAVFLPASRALVAGAADALARFIQAGGGVAILAGPDTTPTAFNSAFADLLPAQLLRTESADAESPWHIANADRSSAVFDAFRLPNSGDLAIAGFTRRFAVEPVKGADILARFEDGVPLLVGRKLGAGRILLLNTSPDTAWTDWPKHKTFVPAVHGIARHLAGRTDDRLLLAGSSVAIGSEVELEIPGEPGAGHKLVGPDGKARPDPDEIAGRIHFEPDLPGPWTLNDAGGQTLLQVAAQLPPSESVLESARPDDFQRRIVRREPTAEEGLAGGWTGTDRNRFEYWRPLLLAAIVLLLAETIVANRSTT